MKIFNCRHCNQLVYFENTHCEHCGHQLGFYPDSLFIETLAETGSGQWQSIPGGEHLQYCANHAFGVCNWLVATNSGNYFCTACQLNKTIPDTTVTDNLWKWAMVEKAKHRLVYSLLRLQLPVFSKLNDPEHGLAFDFLANTSASPVMTGHDDGLITLNVEEADDAFREKQRRQMGEPYRTLLGHFRHESGHYYWNRLIENTGWLQSFRDLFGDERPDYGEALQAYYKNGAPAGWQQHHISVYASSHPWEDWAETWAHYLHMMDTLETAWSFGLRLHTSKMPNASSLQASVETDPYDIEDFRQVTETWLPFTFAMNSINRSMGQPDLYPFVMSETVIQKLSFIHRLCREKKQPA